MRSHSEALSRVSADVGAVARDLADALASDGSEALADDLRHVPPGSLSPLWARRLIVGYAWLLAATVIAQWYLLHSDLSESDSAHLVFDAAQIAAFTTAIAKAVNAAVRGCAAGEHPWAHLRFAA